MSNIHSNDELISTDYHSDRLDYSFHVNNVALGNRCLEVIISCVYSVVLAVSKLILVCLMF